MADVWQGSAPERVLLVLRQQSLQKIIASIVVKSLKVVWILELVSIMVDKTFNI